MGGEKNNKVQLGILALFLFPNLCAKKKPVQVLPQLDLLSGGSFINIPRSTPPRHPSFALSELDSLTKTSGANRWAAWHRGVWSCCEQYAKSGDRAPDKIKAPSTLVISRVSSDDPRPEADSEAPPRHRRAAASSQNNAILAASCPSLLRSELVSILRTSDSETRQDGGA